MALANRRLVAAFGVVFLVAGLVAVKFFCSSNVGRHQESAPSDERSVGTNPAPSDETRKTRQQPSDWFETVTRQTGIDFRYRNGQDGGRYTILESLGGGGAAVDYDRDGLLDLFFNGGGLIDEGGIHGLASALYRNLGNWKFVDSSRESGIDVAGDYSHGCTVADFNADGFADLFVCCYGKCRLFRNMGDGTFRDETGQSGLTDVGWSTAAAWADVDHDGLTDLYVARYLQWSPATDRRCVNRQGVRDVCSPRQFPPADDRLFRNRGDGTFEDFTKRAGLKPGGNGLGVVAGDFNGDGWVDLYVANDETDNRLYLGNARGRLTEVAHRAGVATNEYGMHDGSMGLDVADVNGDGRPDIWVTNFEYEDNVLYRNLGNGLFMSATVVMGLAGHSRPLVGFGTALADFDGDTWPDIVVANGHVFYHNGMLPYRQPAQLFRNLKGRRFENVSKAGGTYFRDQHVGRGLVIADLDNDGALDIVVVHQNEPVTVLRNRHPPKHFVRLELHGRGGNPDAIGATLSCRIGGRNVVRFVGNGNGYFSHSDKRVLFPLAGRQAVDVVVKWPHGTDEVFRVAASRRTHHLIQGSGRVNHGE